MPSSAFLTPLCGRLNNKESEAVVRQLQTPGLDPVQRKRPERVVLLRFWLVVFVESTDFGAVVLLFF